MRIPEIDDKVGMRIRETRELLEMSQSDVAGDALNTSHLSNIENGNRRPSWTALAAIADRLDVDPYWLATGAGDPELEIIREVALTLAEMRGYIVTPGEGIAVEDGRWLLDQIDKALTRIGVLRAVQEATGRALENPVLPRRQ